MECTVREMKLEDVENVVDYFHEATPDFLKAMGADRNKLPERSVWIQKLRSSVVKPVQKKHYYYIIWLLDGMPVGHSNCNAIVYGQMAQMHLHLWDSARRKKGLGTIFLRKTIAGYFRELQLQELFCEPYALTVSYTHLTLPTTPYV